MSNGKRAWFMCALAMFLTPLIVPSLSSAAPNTTDSVIVVPNPYNVAGRLWGTESNPSAFERIRFQNLPIPATIKIYTSAGNHVVTLEHTGDGTRYPIVGHTDSESFNWTGRNADNQYVNSDVYIYVVTSPGLSPSVKKFVILR